MNPLPGSLLLVRHARALGQEPDAPLTPEGVARAVETIRPLAEALHLTLETDIRLTERVLSPVNVPLWQQALKASFALPNLKLPGGESGLQAKARAEAAVEEHRDDLGLTVVVTHGNLMALLLGLEYDGWAGLRNPDVWLIQPGQPGKRWGA